LLALEKDLAQGFGLFPIQHNRDLHHFAQWKLRKVSCGFSHGTLQAPSYFTLTELEKYG
jgi:hypothetical protein